VNRSESITLSLRLARSELKRYSLFGLNPASFKFRHLFNGRITVPTLSIRGEVDGCMPEVTWEQMSPKSFRNGLTLEVMPGIDHFPQFENP
jgi:pimeloyl-ACP methyl ester carboxylesterase